MRTLIGLKDGSSRPFSVPLWFEDLESGLEFRIPGRIKVTRGQIQQFAATTFDQNPIHLREEFAKKTMFQGVVAHGRLVGDLVYGALYFTSFFEAPILLGSGERYLAPVRPGDALRYTLRVARVRASKSFDERGVVGMRFLVINQRDEEVVRGRFTILVKKRQKEEPAS